MPHSEDQPADLPIRDDMIRLGQALKLANLAEDGVEARETIAAGEVLVNGSPETRRGKQLRPGDRISLGEVTVRIVREDELG